MKTQQEITEILNNVTDPEVPVLNINDLGIVREINIKSDIAIEIVITPTYSGCPAMSMIAMDIKLELIKHGFTDIQIKENLLPAWTTDWMSESGKQKLKLYGIAPPQYRISDNKNEETKTVQCPRCNSFNTQLISQFGSTACKALYKCNDCLEPFDYFKCH